MIKKQVVYIILLLSAVASIANAQFNSTMGGKKKSSGFGSSKSSASKKGSSYSSKGGSSRPGSSSKKSKGSSSQISSSQKKSMGASSGGTGSGKASVSAAGATVGARSYPGIGKSKTISGLKGGTKYSYPGVHNVRWDIEKMQKKK